MSDATYAGAEPVLPPLGVGGLISRSFSILFKRFLLLVGLALVVQLLFALINFLAPGLFAPQTVDPVTGAFDTDALPALGAAALLGMIVYAIVQAVLTLAAYDAATEQPTRVGSYFGAVFRNIVPLLIVSVLSAIAIYIGLALLIVPGLWLAAVLSVVVPVIVIEGAGFGAFGRSARLTKEYRWPIVGLLILVFLIFFGVTVLLGLLSLAVLGIEGTAAAALASQTGEWTTSAIVYLLVNAVFGSITYAFLAVSVAALFARLKEIKEGVGVEDLSNVFD